MSRDRFGQIKLVIISNSVCYGRRWMLLDMNMADPLSAKSLFVFIRLRFAFSPPQQAPNSPPQMLLPNPS